MEIDTSTDFGARATRHLEGDRIIWLTTVGPHGTPQPSPVWFLWDGDTVLIYSSLRPQNCAISTGILVSVCTSTAPRAAATWSLSPATPGSMLAPTCQRESSLCRQVCGGLRDIGMTPDAFAQAFSVAIRVRPRSLRGH